MLGTHGTCYAGGGVTSYGSSETVTFQVEVYCSLVLAVQQLCTPVVHVVKEYVQKEFSFESVTNYMANKVDVFLNHNGIRIVSY